MKLCQVYKLISRPAGSRLFTCYGNKTMRIPTADEDAWNNAEGKNNGRLSYIRYRPGLQEYLGNPAYSRRLTIFWDYEDDGLGGMPSSELSDQMKDFEDSLVHELDPDRAGILAFIYTSAGTREWHFYLKNDCEISLRINQALSVFPKLPIELQMQDDPEWAELKGVYSLCK